MNKQEKKILKQIERDMDAEKRQRQVNSRIRKQTEQEDPNIEKQIKRIETLLGQDPDLQQEAKDFVIVFLVFLAVALLGWFLLP